MKKVLSILLAVAMLMTSTCIVFAGAVDVAVSDTYAYGDLTAKRDGGSIFFDSITVLKDGKFDVAADLEMSEIRARYAYEYNLVMDILGKSEQARNSKVAGGFTFVMTVPEGITVPDSVINGSNMSGFDADLDMWEEVDRSFVDGKLSISVKVKDGITAEKLYNNIESYLKTMRFTGEGFTADEVGEYILKGKMEVTDESGFVTIYTPNTVYGIQIITDPLKPAKGIQVGVNVTDEVEKAQAIAQNEEKVAQEIEAVEEAVGIAMGKLTEYLQSEEYDFERDTELVLKKKFASYVDDELTDEKVRTDIEFEGLGGGTVVFYPEVAIYEGDADEGTYVEKITQDVGAADVNMIPIAMKKAKEILDSKQYPSNINNATLAEYVNDVQAAIAEMGVEVICSPVLNPAPTTTMTGIAEFVMTFKDGVHEDGRLTVKETVAKKSVTPGGGGTGGGGGIINIINNDNNNNTQSTEVTAPIPDALNGYDHILYIIGYEDGTSRPENNISRAEVATIFYRLLKPEVRDQYYTTENKFSDVSANDWFNAEVSTMANLGIVKGRTESTFEPNEPITRAEYAAICARFDKSSVSGTSNFTDIAGHWAKAEIDRVAQIGWILGYSDSTFRPDVNIIRAEAITLTNRVLHRLPESEADLLPGMITFPDNQPTDWFYLAVQEASNAHNFERKSDGLHEKWTSLKN